MMNNQLQVLKQTELCGRQFTVYGTPEEPLFLASDVAAWIQHSNVSKMLQSVDDDEKLTSPIVRAGQNRECNFLTEDGLYEILMQSRKPIAKQFKKGVKKILHEIRTIGGYLATKENEAPETIMARAVLVAQATIEKQNSQLREQQQILIAQGNQIAELAPKAKYTDEVLQSTSGMTFTEVAKELGYRSAKAFLDRLVSARVLYRQSGRYLPMAKYSDKGYFSTRTHRFYHSDGRPDCSVMTVVTQKGRAFLNLHFNNINNIN